MSLPLRFYDEEIAFFTPPENISPSQWAARYRTVTEGEHKGPWINENFAYLVEPMDTWARPHIESIILCFAPQTGKSQIAMNCLGFVADQAPGPIMYVMPTENKAKDFSGLKLKNLFLESQRLKALLSSGTTSWGTLNLPLLNGTHIRTVWANSPSALSEVSIQYLFFDECDKYEEFSGKEADPLALGEVRTTAYPNTKKIMYLSTPNRENGPITRVMNYKADEIRDFYAVCPTCGHAQIMIFDQIKWPKEIRDPRTMENGRHAKYECEACRFLWNDYQRNIAVSRGHWLPRIAVIRPRSVAFHLPVWYSRNRSLSYAAARFLEGLNDHTAKYTFVTQVKAEAFKEVVKTTVKADLLKARCDLPPQTVPEAAIALTLGVDVQKYGLWFLVRAFARDYTSWLIHYGETSWEQLEQLICEQAYPIRNSDRAMRIWRVGIDTGGSESVMGVSATELTYSWIIRLIKRAALRQCHVFGTKGSSSTSGVPGTFKYGEPIVKMPSGKKIDNPFKLVLIDTHEMKDTYHRHLQQAISGDPQGAYLHAGEESDYRTYTRHILAEEKRRDRKGAESWVKIRNDNHLFDCEILAMSLAHWQWPLGGINLYRPVQPEPPAPPPPPISYDRGTDLRERFSRRSR